MDVGLLRGLRGAVLGAGILVSPCVDRRWIIGCIATPAPTTSTTAASGASPVAYVLPNIWVGGGEVGIGRATGTTAPSSNLPATSTCCCSLLLPCALSPLSPLPSTISPRHCYAGHMACALLALISIDLANLADPLAGVAILTNKCLHWPSSREIQH